MKTITLLLLSVLFLNFAQAQQKAVTENGEEVTLYDDGTWEYLDKKEKEASEEKEIPTNTKAFTKSAESTFLLKSNKLNIGFWLNSKKWSFRKAVENPDAEYELQLKNESLYGMIIAEKIEIPLDVLRSVAIENAKSIAPDLKVINEEYRTVNGLKLLHLQMHGSTRGIKFAYYGYYFSNAQGSVQFVAYTTQNLMEEYKPQIEILLNGLVELK